MYDVVGNEVRKGGQLVETCSSHSEAKKAAESRRDTGNSVALSPTVGRLVLFEFDDAKHYVSVVDVDKAMSQDLAGESDPEKIQELVQRSAEEVTQAHQIEVRAKQADAAFSDKSGASFPAGSWVVLCEDGSSQSLTDEAFRVAYVAKKGKAKGKKAAGSAGNDGNAAS